MTKWSLVLLGAFWFPSLVGRAKEKIDEKKLSSWKLLDDFRRRLAIAQAAAPTREKRPGGSERMLLEEDYLSLMLFGLFNPALDSMRGLCAASRLKRMQQDVCSRPVSLGSFSEAQGVFDPGLLKQVFMKKGETIVGDRYYGLEYGFFEELRQLGVSFVFPHPQQGASPGLACPDGTLPLENTVVKPRVVAASMKITGFFTTPPNLKQASCRTVLSRNETELKMD